MTAKEGKELEKQETKARRRLRLHHTLTRWIVLGCVTMMIPIVCAGINTAVNRSFMEKKIREVNEFSLNGIRHSIDKKLSNLTEVAKYCLTDTDFSMYRLETKDSSQFLVRARECWRILNLITLANENVEIMVYLPEQNYIVDSRTANKIQFLYDSLTAQKRISVSLEEWKAELDVVRRNQFLVSDQLGYGNYGTSCLVYATMLMGSGSQASGYLFCSIPDTFIRELMDSETNQESTVLILNADREVTAQFGREISLPEGGVIPEEVKDSEDTFRFQTDQETYVAAFAESEVNGWQYVVCTPERVYLSEVSSVTRANLVIILIGAVVGVAAIIGLMRNNYRPIRQLADILPEREEMPKDELEEVEHNLRRLFQENRQMQNSILLKEQYEKERQLLMAMRGRHALFAKITAEELLGADFREKNLMFASVRTGNDPDPERNQPAMEYDLFEFVVNNVMTDLFAQEPAAYRTVVDGDLVVFLFLIDRTVEMERWKTICRERFSQLCEFFETRLACELSITIGSVFENTDVLASEYAELLEANTARMYIQPDGILYAAELETAGDGLTDRTEYYSKRFAEAAASEDGSLWKTVSNEFFRMLEAADVTYQRKQYYVLAVVNGVLAASGDLVSDGMLGSDSLERNLHQMREDESFSALRKDFACFQKLVCRAVRADEKESNQLSEQIQEYVQAHFRDSELNITAVADTFHLTPRYLSRVYKEQTGLTLLNSINDMRIAYAKELLLGTDKTVDEIAQETGFTNVRTFRRNFQKAVGVNASDFKEAGAQRN